MYHTEKTIAGTWYTITCTAPATVTQQIDGQPATLATLEKSGTTAFRATASAITVETDGKYHILPTKPLATLVIGSTSSTPSLTPPYIAYNANRSEITAADLTGLTDGRYMFYSCDLAGFSIDLPSLTKGDKMFYGCTSLTSFSSDLPSLTYASNMFEDCSSLTSFSIDLPSLTKGDKMFYGCRYMTSFSGALPLLNSGQTMFFACMALKKFNEDLPSLTTGASMFNGCSSLTSFRGALPLLENGSNMFGGDTSLVSFESDLSALTSGSSMFSSCVLNKESALRILNTIPAYTSGTHKLTLGMAAELSGDADITAALTAASAKGWTVTAQYNE